MKNIRIIPRLDIKGPNLVKGIQLEGLRVLGDPIHFARLYYEQGADEIFFQDVVASLYGKNSLNNAIKSIAKQIFIPLTVGGGIRTIADIRAALQSGADKVAINTAAVQDPSFIQKAVKIFGSSTIVVAIEAIKQSNGKYFIFTDNGREHTGIEALPWAKKMEEFGAGELVVTSVDREGTGKGFEIELIKSISESVSIPVIAHGGAGKPADVAKVILEGKADAVAISSILHYDSAVLYHADNLQKKAEGNYEFLDRNLSFLNVQTTTVPALKNELIKFDINCRVI
jgi:cyclase